MDQSQITQTSMSVYITFSIMYFIFLLARDYDIQTYILIFVWFVGTLQFLMNIWASTHLCKTDDKNTPDLTKAFGYTFIPWILILCLTSFILHNMPGWVRIFSNTIGLAIVQSAFHPLFSDIKKPEPHTDRLINELINDIYRDPSKLINEVEYLAGFENWYKEIFIGKGLNETHYFTNDKFKVDGNIENISHEHLLYQLYLCISWKEKIGYFIWLFLLGVIFILVSLCQMFESDC